MLIGCREANMSLKLNVLKVREDAMGKKIPCAPSHVRSHHTFTINYF